MNRAIFTFFILIIISSCNSKDNINIIDLSSEFDIDVHRTKINRALYINEEYIFPTSFLIYCENYPKWIIEDGAILGNQKNPKIISLSDIKTPYRIIKSQNSNYIKVIKYGDTLRFYLSMSDY